MITWVLVAATFLAAVPAIADDRQHEQGLGATECRAFLVWRRGAKTPGRGETFAAATVD